MNMSYLYHTIRLMFAIVISSFGLIMFVQGMGRVFNLRIRARRAKTVGNEEDPIEG